MIASLAALALAAISASRPAGATDAAGFAQRMFGAPVGSQRAEACFVRRYDAAHLAQHKRQKVTDMKLLVTAEMVAEADKPVYGYHVEMKLRSQASAFTATGDCSHAEASDTGREATQIRCDVGCGGAGLTVRLANDNRSTMLEITNIAISPRGKSTPEDERIFKGTVDNRLYRLDRAPLADCLSLSANHVAKR
jgi:hypothetical protein